MIFYDFIIGLLKKLPKNYNVSILSVNINDIKMYFTVLNKTLYILNFI